MVKEATRQFRDGDVIFREGDDSLAVFRVERGRVRLIKAGIGGSVVLATLARGELFGEMGILDGTARSASALAEGETTLTVIPRAAFLDRLQSDADLSFQVMTKLVQRLRDADERLARAALSAEAPPAPAASAAAPPEPEIPLAARRDAPRAGLLTRLFGRRGGSAAAEPEAQNAGPLRVIVARFSDMSAVESTIVEEVVQALNLIPGALVRRVDDAVAWPDEIKDPEAARQTAARAAQALLAKAGGDVLVWGRVETIGRLLEVHATAQPALHELRLGRVPPVAAVHVPLEALPEPLAALLRAMTAAAPLAEGVRRGGNLYAPLAEDVAAAAEGLKRAVSGFAAAEQAAALVAWACAASQIAGAEGLPETLWDDIARAFEDAGRRLPRAARGDWADVFIGRALLECARAERAPTAEPPPEGTPWDAAAETLRLALEGVRREERPFEWALLHERLGLIAYRQALASGDEAHFKAALAHYQQATGVFTRADLPQRWAEVVSALAQVLQVFGDQLGSAPALERAVELIRATLDVRSEEAVPLLWAASQNNLGSALFLLAKRRDSAALFDDAAAAFRNAVGMYQIHGQGRLAAVTEKNLARALDASRLRARRDGRLAQPEWAGDGENLGGDLPS